MFSREHISWIVEDIFRTEIVKQRKDSLAFFDRQEMEQVRALDPAVLAQATAQVGTYFGFTPQRFSSLQELISQSYDAYTRNQFVYLTTSGSTGKPKLCLHTQEMMDIEGKSVGNHFTRARRFVTLTPRQHLYGLSFAIFFTSLFDIPTTPVAPMPLQPWHTLLREGDVVAGFPLFWEYFLKAGNTLPAGVTAVTSTAPCPKGLFARLKQAGAVRVVELYGASETGGIGVREAQEDPFEINDFWEVSCREGTYKIRRKGIEGWLDFPDQVEFVPPRGIFPLKRMDRVVQVAGVNVSLTHVEHVLQSYPAVAACKVRLMRPEEGRRLKAFIVLKQPASAEVLPAIQSFLSKKLSSHEMPRHFTFGATLPTNVMGKDCDW